MTARPHPLVRAALALLLAGAAASGFAADAPGAQACRADAQKLCAGAKPGGGRVMACLKQHEAELSPATARLRCRRCSNARRRCRRSAAGSGRRDMRECLRSHADQLSPECRGRQP